MKNSVTLELDVRTAAAVRESLFRDTKMYSYDEKSCPQRVNDIRNVIVSLDEQIEAELKAAAEEIAAAQEISELEAQAPDPGVGK